MRLVWGPELIVGYEALDEQHQSFVRRVSELDARIKIGDEEGAVETIGELSEELMRHFAAEEALMDSCHYPEKAAHKGAHDLFIQDALAMAHEASSRGLTVTVREWARGRLPEWFAFHVQTNDAPLARYAVQWQLRPGAAPATSKPRLD